jgi:hypothetical protein
MENKPISSLIFFSIIIGLLSCSGTPKVNNENTYEFLTNIPELNGEQEFKVSDESKGVELSSLEYGETYRPSRNPL